MSRLYGLLMLLMLIPVLSFSVRTEPADKKELSEITRRGRLLAEYDRAASYATDTLQASDANPKVIQQYVARKMADGWHVVFGELQESKGVFEIYYELVQEGNSNKYKRIKIDGKRLDRTVYYSSVRALMTAYKDFLKANKPKRRYNTAIVPADNGKMWVYLLPAPVKIGHYPLGGDVRYLISSDGGKILSKKRLHKGIIERNLSAVKRTRGYSFHPAILDDAPEDTDVFHVLSRKPVMPHLVITLGKQYVYQIAVDGSIRYLGKQNQIFSTQPPAGP